MELVSDLHVEFGTPPGFPTEKQPTDVVLAGDIGKISDGSWFRAVNAAAAVYNHVYVIIGNHEYYNKERLTMNELVARVEASIATLSNVTLLNRAAVRAETTGVWLLGCTLWSDIEDSVALNDFRCIWVTDESTGKPRHLTHAEYRALFRAEKEWLLSALADIPEGEKAIIATHHGPCMELNPPEYADSELTSGFVSEVPLPADKVAISLSGHTHGRLKVTSPEGIPCVANCRGYPKELPGPYTTYRVPDEVIASCRRPT